MIRLNSSSIDTIHFDYENSSLYVKFKSGRCYKYNNVPAYVYNGFLNTSSVGKYFNSQVRGKFECEPYEDIPENYSPNLCVGEQSFSFVVLDESETLKIIFSDGRNFSVPLRTSGRSQTHIPYWVTLKVRRAPLLVEHLQAFIQSSGVKEGLIAWNGKDFRPILKESDFESGLCSNSLEGLSEEERIKEERRQKRIEIAKKAFSIPLN